MTRTVLLTGVSSGIGEALALNYLEQGNQVFGISRRTPEQLTKHPGFHFRSHDLTQHNETENIVEELLHEVDHLDLVILNAGILGRIDDMRSTSLADLKELMDVNTWANKTLIDCLYSGGRSIGQIVTISSGAAVNGNRGWNGYSISKAALNMLTMLYAAENPQTHFVALAPGLVDTAMQEYLCGHGSDERFPSLNVLKSKRETSEMPTPGQLAPRLATIIDSLPEISETGSFVDIRSLPVESTSM